MRFLTTSFAIVLALVAFGPTRTVAKEPGGGHPGGGQPSVGQHGTATTVIHQQAGPNLAGTRDAGTGVHQNAAAEVHPQFSLGAAAGAAATADSWRYRSDNGRWWYWTPQNRWMWYGDNGQWVDYSADAYPPARAYVVRRPILPDPLPAASFSGGPITISNPATNKATLNYTLDGTAYTIQPGYTQDLREDRAWAIQFSRGANLGQAQYGLQSGLYSFTSTDHGWELYRSDLPRAAPANRSSP
ncbi:MAG: hypothetical protein ABSG86_26375 [Thermoguttaceae bacterium]|jgi:hypothetical protein